MMAIAFLSIRNVSQLDTVALYKYVYYIAI